jgi:thiol-disulfide isomerase/thioredoxin
MLKGFLYASLIAISLSGCKSREPVDFSLLDINGQQIRLSDYRSKIVLVDFWATWCPPCRMSVPELIALQNEYKKDLVIIGISVDREDTKGSVPQFVEEAGINYHVVYADDAVIQAFGGITAIPTSFILDKDGTIVTSHVGFVTKSTLADDVLDLLL